VDNFIQDRGNLPLKNAMSLCYAANQTIAIPLPLSIRKDSIV